MKILSAEQIHKWDEFTILNEPVSSLDLMERAAAKCTAWIEERYMSKPVKIFCGKGNNGGDGLAIARQLSAENILCDVYIMETGSLGTDDFRANLHRLHSSPARIHFVQNPDFFPEISPNDLVIDALFGSGLNRPLEGLAATLVQHINTSAATVIAIDLPSGMFCDKATSTGAVIKADFTLTFQTVKLCFLFPENEPFFGDVHVLDIGLHPDYLTTINSVYNLVELELIKKIYRPRKKFSHKGTYGHALIIAGEKGKMGAAVMCSKACLRAGAGLVSAMIPEEHFTIIQTAVPEAMAMAHTDIETLEWTKYTTIGIGPGIGTKKEGGALFQNVLSHFNNALVIDADALNILSVNQELLGELPPGSILSPHPKEFERLFGKTKDQLEKIQVARSHAQKFFIYIILKGHNSVLACPDGEVYFNGTGNPGMATGGSGDVLTGILTGLLAQRYSSKETCLMGMFLHGLAADIAVKTISQEAMIAGDIIDNLGNAFLTVSSSL
ncbi:bifunctional ADP-dependent NAD(P)H-hydrate dehydratase/NAD(P)H-hydrate epimerase [Segetibacter koreensis]|uniref:bifunctional ADP-dependent NAD(P)H-hydrate dehydratase/NAD(P)H-hydrate epimerase n=1 Tax=Segetibacter koreensis TaxID=398037 RepID=UPI0003737E7F|nr:bifunctional ADP-dependent NAD(P)H-hydrate dehydratase/NAD(P)H-hydrate epimerase [Segetibacter koreensis]